MVNLPWLREAVGSWDTSKVTAMQSMFSGARSFNQPLRHWKTSNVRDMSQMFWDARSFNQAGWSQPVKHFKIQDSGDHMHHMLVSNL